MRISIVFLLAITGVFLGVFHYKQSKEVNSSGYIEGLSLINQLKHTNADLNILLLKSRYGLETDDSEMQKKAILLNSDLIKLREQYLAPYLDDGGVFSSALKEYENSISLKIDLVEKFKSHNGILRNAIKVAPQLGESLIADLELSEHTEPANLLRSVNRSLYRWSLYGDQKEAEVIQGNSRKIINLVPFFENDSSLFEYNSHLMVIVDEQAQAQNFLNKALSSDTEIRLSQVDALYTESYLAKMKSVGKMRNFALIGYGIFAALVALYFAWMLRKSYLELEDKVKHRTQEINNAYSELKESQEQLVQSEKMASLGQMVAGVAHEINTPLGYVNNNVSIINSLFFSLDDLMSDLDKVYQEAAKKPQNKEQLYKHLLKVLKRYRRINDDELISEAKELLSDTSHGLDDISELVKNLRSFSRLDRQNVEQFDIGEGLDNTLKIASNILRQHNVEVVKDFDDLVFLECNPSKINQVFLNIITNAAQSMPENGGQLTIDVEKIGDNITIRFTDTGQGMDAEARAKIFDPFFTTKPVGEGTGLGMAISYKIVKEHNGQVDVRSDEGEGTTIILTFPQQQPGG